MSHNLNIGCSYVEGQYRSNWINLDIEKHKGVSVRGSCVSLPFKDNSIGLIHCVHVLEHIKRNLYFDTLKEMYRVIMPGHSVFVEVPDFIAVISKLLAAKDKNGIHKWTTSIYGKNEIPGMAHHWGFTQDLLTTKMTEIGFKKVYRCSENEVSNHYKQEPVLVICGVK
jgi:predicted SAM-dependent methyltransferase